MMIKRNKEDLLSLIHSDVEYAVMTRISSRLSEGSMVSITDLRYIIQQSIAEGVRAGIETLLENQYTDDDFERDMTLKP